MSNRLDFDIQNQWVLLRMKGQDDYDKWRFGYVNNYKFPSLGMSMLGLIATLTAGIYLSRFDSHSVLLSQTKVIYVITQWEACNFGVNVFYDNWLYIRHGISDNVVFGKFKYFNYNDNTVRLAAIVNNELASVSVPFEEITGSWKVAEMNAYRPPIWY